MKSKKNNKKKENDLWLFSDIEMTGGRSIKKRNNDDLEQFTDAVVKALQILEKLDEITINKIAEECYYNSIDSSTFCKKEFYLHSLPGYYFDIIQYCALEFCVQQKAIPYYKWRTTMPEGCYERGLQQYKQKNEL